jgi:hypothetical protein
MSRNTPGCLRGSTTPHGKQARPASPISPLAARRHRAQGAPPPWMIGHRYAPPLAWDARACRRARPNIVTGGASKRTTCEDPLQACSYLARHPPADQRAQHPRRGPSAGDTTHSPKSCSGGPCSAPHQTTALPPLGRGLAVLGAALIAWPPARGPHNHRGWAMWPGEAAQACWPDGAPELYTPPPARGWAPRMDSDHKSQAWTVVCPTTRAAAPAPATTPRASSRTHASTALCAPVSSDPRPRPRGATGGLGNSWLAEAPYPYRGELTHNIVRLHPRAWPGCEPVTRGRCNQKRNRTAQQYATPAQASCGRARCRGQRSYRVGGGGPRRDAAGAGN